MIMFSSLANAGQQNNISQLVSVLGPVLTFQKFTISQTGSSADFKDSADCATAPQYAQKYALFVFTCFQQAIVLCD